MLRRTELHQLFQHRDGHRLTLSAYYTLGGVKGALIQQAEYTYAALPSDQHRQMARILFLRLIDPGTNMLETTGRRAAFSELSLPDPQQTDIIRQVADVFISARLLITNDIAGTKTIEVANEVLIHEWTRLKAWINEARDDILLQQAISEDANEWMQRGKSRDRLYRGSQLKEAQAWAKRNIPSEREVVFLQAGLVQGRTTRLLYFVIGTVIVILLILLLFLKGIV